MLLIFCFVVLRPRKSLLLDNVPYSDTPRNKTWPWFAVTDTAHFPPAFFICDKDQDTVMQITQWSSIFHLHCGHNNKTIITCTVCWFSTDVFVFNAMNYYFVNSVCLAKCWINCKNKSISVLFCVGHLAFIWYLNKNIFWFKAAFLHSHDIIYVILNKHTVV